MGMENKVDVKGFFIELVEEDALGVNINIKPWR